MKGHITLTQRTILKTRIHIQKQSMRMQKDSPRWRLNKQKQRREDTMTWEHWEWRTSPHPESTSPQPGSLVAVSDNSSPTDVAMATAARMPMSHRTITFIRSPRRSTSARAGPQDWRSLRAIFRLRREVRRRPVLSSCLARASWRLRPPVVGRVP